jgi:uncharacterized protein
MSGLSLLLAASLASAATPGVRDGAHMFSAPAVRQADEQLTDLHRKHGWEIVFETVETLDGKSIDQAAEDKARSLQVRGVYFLVAEREHKIHYWIQRPALTTFDKATVESVTQTVIGRFKQKQYDDALLKAVGSLTEAANSGPSAPAQGPSARSAPSTSRPDLAPRPNRETERGGSFLGTALVIGAVLVGILLLVRVIAAVMRPAGGVGPGYGYGGGGPGYGFGGGGGFLGNMMAGIGGALLGNYLYNSWFGGGQARAAEPFGESGSTSASTFDDQGASGGADWGASASAEDSDGGGDDFGGSDFGGGDFGGGDGGGGDF